MKTRSRLLSALLLPIVLIAAAVFTVESLTKGEDALIQRQYAAAVQHLEAALNETTGPDRERARLLLARARWLAGDHDAAVADYRAFLADHPQSGLAAKARLQQAEALAASRKFEAAARLYREEIARLTGPERKEEVAATYLGLAEKAVAATPPAHERAVTFYDLALELGLSAARERSVKLLAAEARLAQGQVQDAIRRLDPLVAELEVGQGKRRAMLALGRARAAAHEKARARVVLRDLMAIAEPAMGGDAAYVIAQTFDVPTPNSGQLDRAVAALRDLAERYPSHPRAKVAEYLIARCMAHNGRSEAALASLRAFLAASVGEELEERAEASAMVGDVLASQGRSAEAIEAWRAYLAAHTAHDQWERVQRAIVDTEYQQAVAAVRAGPTRYAEARERFADFARAYPLDGRNPEILFTLGRMHEEEDAFEAARDAYQRCVSKYPGLNASSRAQYRIGIIWETEQFNYAKALEAYRAVTWGEYAGQARERIAALERKELRLLTPRTFRSGETAAFELTSRNIEKVRVRVYRLDLETWFRATHTPGAVERLDIEVIEPDRTFDSGAIEYQKYQKTEREVPIGFDEPGAYVVKVDDRELEATTLVMVTDIAMIAKSSRHEFFVFTQNLRDERVESGVRVVLSDGESVVAEGVTDANGVWRYRGEELQRVEELRAFVVNAAGSGAGSLSLSGLGYTGGLTPKGYLFTDRPTYKPGQTVHVKGIVREVDGGQYRVAEAGDYIVEVRGPDGRLVRRDRVQFTEFGSFALDVALPAQVADLGTWRVDLRRESKPTESYTRNFEVAEFALPRVSIAGTAEQRVVYRGEPLKGEFEVRYFFGEPAVGKAVEITLRDPDGRQHLVREATNAAGRVKFEFGTEEYPESALAVVTARLVEENVSTSLMIPVAATEVTASASTIRDVYLVGEPFDVTVKLTDLSGEPVARKAEVVLLRQEVSDGVVAEVEVARESVETKGESGEGVVALAASDGGAHSIRVTTIDRSGAVVSHELPVTISGEEDSVKVRILSDRQSYEVGETVAVRVVNRTEARLALRTIQGDGILAYEAVQLPAGESTQRVTLEAMHAPNFALAYSLIDGTELRLADREFRVARDLRIEVTPRSEVVRPGGKVSVDLQVTDAQGRPVSAEVALAVVDKSLLAVYPDVTPAIGAFFHGHMRETAFRTVSSCGWKYEGPSRRVSDDLIAEEQRRHNEQEKLLRSGASVLTASDEFFMGAGRAGLKPGVGGGGGGPASGGPGVVYDRVYQSLETATRDARIAHDDRKESAFDSDQWNSAVGLGGGRGRLTQFQEIGAFLALPSTGYTVGRVSYGLELASSTVATDEPRVNFSESGGWVSSAVTDAEGRATIELELPDNTTAWQLTARAATKATDVGEGRAVVRTSKPLQVGLTAPLALTEGDRVTVSGTAHNTTAADVTAKFTVRTTREDEEVSWDEPEPIKLAAGEEVTLAESIAATSVVPMTVGVRLRPEQDGVEGDWLEQPIAVRPFGVERRAGRAGVARDGESFELSLPTGRDYSSVVLRIEVGPDPSRDLVAAALGAGFRPVTCRRVDRTNSSIALRGLAALRVLEHLEGSGRQSRSDVQRLTAMVEQCAALLVTQQSNNGSYAWVGRSVSDLDTTAAAVRFLAGCRARGLSIAEAPLTRAADWIVGQLNGLSDPDRVVAVEALASCGRARFETLNSLHRRRSDLSLAHLGRLAVAWELMGRKEMVGEIAGLLRQKLTLGQSDPGPGAMEVEAVALAVRALLVREPANTADIARAIAWLEGARRGGTWGTPAATAATIDALLRAGQRPSATEVANVNLGVAINDVTVDPIAASVDGPTRVFILAGDKVAAQGNRVRLSVVGSQPVHYSAVLSGAAAGFVDADRNREFIRINRRYEPAQRRDAGQPINRGFSVVDGSYKSFRNDVRQLPVGAPNPTGHVNFYITDKARADGFGPVILEEPIPAGCTVPRESIRGGFDDVVIEPDQLVFYFRAGTRSGSATYDLQARFPGTFRALPSRVYGASQPGLIAHGPVMRMEVLPRGQESSDEYRFSPDELFALGKNAFDRGELQRAGEHLGQLVAEWSLRDSIAREVSRMMLFVSIAAGDSAAVVRYFEDLKDRQPDLVIPFREILAVGQAYIDIGEFEAALLVFRATAEASFLKEAAVATTLESLGETKSSLRFLRGLLEVYPDLATMRASLYGIGQRLAELAAGMADGAPVDDRVGSRAALRGAAVETLREFLVWHPEDKLAEEVSFAWTTTLVEAGDLDGALGVARRALARYPDSTLEDELLYTVGFAEFARGQSKDAFPILERVATETFPRPGGGKGPSENRNHAIYLQGQIHHALGEPAAAIARYDEVLQQFSDAQEAADYFRRKALRLPEVETVATKAKVELEIEHRNLESVALKVYRVDLMRLYVLEKSLNSIRDVLLHGIAPHTERSIELGDGADYRDRKTTVELPLDEPGAYLVVARSGDLVASGMVLRSDLAIEAQEDLGAGRIRVNVRRDGAFLGDAHVKIVGSGDQQIRSGDTDLRGVFAVGGLVGEATVIVKHGDSYAFYRGEGVHQPSRYRPVPSQQMEPVREGGDADKALKRFDAFDNNLQLNSGNRGRQIRWLENEVLNKKQKGVEVFRTK